MDKIKLLKDFDLVSPPNTKATEGMKYFDLSKLSPEDDFVAFCAKNKALPAWRRFAMPLPKNNVAVYIILVYSADSPLNNILNLSLSDKKKQAALMAGFRQNEKGKFPAIVENSMIEINNDAMLDLVFQFLRMQNDRIWTEIITLQEEYDEAVRLRIKTVTNEVSDKNILGAADLKSRLRRECENILENLAKYEKKFYGENTEVKEKIRESGISLEGVAKKLF
jgi:hypothetical protein